MSMARKGRLALNAWGWMAAVRLLLWICPFRRVGRLCAWAGRRGTGNSGPAEVERAIAAARRWVPHATCLTRALAEQILMRRNGHDARVHIGVALDAGSGFLAHAWVESSAGGSPKDVEADDYASLLVF